LVYSRRYTNYVLGMLSGVVALDLLHRQVLALLIDPIGNEFGLSDTQRGALAAGYALAYGLGALLVARIADRTNRRRLIVLCVFFWDLMAAWGGMAQSFTTLLAARIGVGAGCAGTTPAGQSLLADYFPPEKRATAMGIFSGGAMFGTLIGLGIWGWIANHYGWRMAFYSAGAVGLVFGFVLELTVKEPPRGHSEGRSDESSATPSMGEVLRTLWNFRSYRHLLAGGTLAALATMSGGQWNPPFFMRIHGFNLAQTGIALALITGVIGTFGIVGGGVLADRLAVRDRRWYVWMPALGMLIAAPLFIATYLWPTARGALVLLTVPTLTAFAYAAPLSAIMQALAPLRMRSTAAGIMMSAVMLLGMGLGPQLTGIVSDLLAKPFGGDSLRYALAVISLLNIGAALHFYLASRTLLQDLEFAKGAAAE